MLLSELEYFIIKKYLGTDNGFTLQGYKANEYRNDYRVQEALNSMFFGINEALARLVDLNKIPHRLLKLKSENCLIKLNMDVKEVYALTNEQYYAVPFLRLDNRTIEVFNDSKNYYYIEVVEDLCIRKTSFEEDIELTDLNISNQVCMYIVEFAYGKILEEISPSEASIHISSAESYFAGLPSAARKLNVNIRKIYRM